MRGPGELLGRQQSGLPRFRFGDLREDLELIKQARQLARWDNNIVIKVPQTNSQGLPCYGVMHKLESEGIKVNATVAMSIGQVLRQSAHSAQL